MSWEDQELPGLDFEQFGKFIQRKSVSKPFWEIFACILTKEKEGQETYDVQI